MKAQFKYAFLSGLYLRAYVFAVIFVMNVTFVSLGAAGALPFAALIVAVSLGGVAIAVMMAANIIGDIAIARRLFSPPQAYLYALTPVPRWKTLFASIAAMTVMDIVTMTFVIVTQVWMSLNLAGEQIVRLAWEFITQTGGFQVIYLCWAVLVLIALYFLVLTVILLCVTANKSIFYKKPASAFLSFLLGCACIYAFSLLQLLKAPFAQVQRYGFIIVINTDASHLPADLFITLLGAFVFFVLTSKLMERKLNI